MTVVPLADATDEAAFGGKAAGLARAICAGLRVPAGLAVAVDGAPDPEIAAALRAAGLDDGRALAVRSSAAGEDSARDSFAGLLLSVMGVEPADVPATVRRVRASGSSPEALAYRQARGLAGEARVGVVIQELVPADVSGVMFTREPLDGSQALVIEAARGLGERVVAGKVTPAGYRLDAAGSVVSHRAAEVGVDPRLDDELLCDLARLAARCDELFPGGSDVEWAVAGGTLWVLQRRPITSRPR